MSRFYAAGQEKPYPEPCTGLCIRLFLFINGFEGTGSAQKEWVKVKTQVFRQNSRHKLQNAGKQTEYGMQGSSNYLNTDR